MYKRIKLEGHARRGEYTTPHGTVQTPVFMNVGTQAAIKGGVDAFDLHDLGCQIELSNTYHLHLRPGDDVVRQMGGLHRFMNWDGPILTDSGGFQVFSLASLRKITEEGVTFASHLDGHRIFMGPEESMRIQSNLGSDIAMAFDECVENPAQYDYAKASCERTLRWLERCKAEHDRLNALPDAVNPHQMLFGINQGATYEDLRVWHMQQIAKIDCDGFAIGGLAVGEPTEVMYRIIEAVEPYMPAHKPRYLMGVGTPSNIIEGVARGVDFFDCVMPARNARHGKPRRDYAPHLHVLKQYGQKLLRRVAQAKAEYAAQYAQYQRLYQKHARDAAKRGAYDLQYAYLLRALGYGHHHRICNSDCCNNQGNGSDSTKHCLDHCHLLFHAVHIFNICLYIIPHLADLFCHIIDITHIIYFDLR